MFVCGLQDGVLELIGVSMQRLLRLEDDTNTLFVADAVPPTTRRYPRKGVIPSKWNSFPPFLSFSSVLWLQFDSPFISIPINTHVMHVLSPWRSLSSLSNELIAPFNVAIMTHPPLSIPCMSGVEDNISKPF
jgi:hypothetical protein